MGGTRTTTVRLCDGISAKPRAVASIRANGAASAPSGRSRRAGAPGATRWGGACGMHARSEHHDRHRRATLRRARAPTRTTPAGERVAAALRPRASPYGTHRPPVRRKRRALRPRRGAAIPLDRRGCAGRRDDRVLCGPPPPRRGARARAARSAASSARASAALAGAVRNERSATSAATSSATATSDGGTARTSSRTNAACGLIEAAEQQQRGAQRSIAPVAALARSATRVQRGRSGRGQRARRAAEVALGQRHLGLGNDTARAYPVPHAPPKPRAARRSSSRARADSPSRAIGDAAQRQRRRVAAQRPRASARPACHLRPGRGRRRR